jgi:hypothetical protein
VNWVQPMMTATLRLTVSPKNKKRMVFVVHGDASSATFSGPAIADGERLQAELSKHDYSDDTQRARVLRRFADEFVPHGFATWFRQWISDWDRESVLCVHAEDRRLSALPWAEILLPTGAAAGRSWVARVCHPRAQRPPPAPKPSVRMLLAAWADLTGHTMAGVLREMHEFPGKVDRGHLSVQILAEPTRRQFLYACEKDRAALLHISSPSLIDDRGLLAIPTTVEPSKSGSSRRRPPTLGFPGIDAVALADLNTALSKTDELRMVVINTCHAERGCEQIARALGVVSIGWPALVTDDVAADFTFYFYQRLLEGSTPLAAIRSFARTIGSKTPVDLPVVWLPSPEWAAWCPLAETDSVPKPVSRAARAAPPGKRTRKKAAAAARLALAEVPLIETGSTAVQGGTPSEPAMIPSSRGLRLEFRPRAAINPALLVNGLHPIEHLSIESPCEQEMHLCIECDTGADTSTFRQTVALKKGVVPVGTTDIHFPALHELIERHARRRRISFTATLTTPGGEEVAGQTRTAQWMGAKEWLDQEDTWAFIPAFVNPFDEGVLKVFEVAKKVLRTLGHPSDTFNGYQQGDTADYVSTQMKAIFQTLRDDSIGLTYIAPPGSPIFDSSKRPCGQVVRTHAEVVERKLGTCHDLALLVAACAEYIGIRPLICLIPGHTFVAYWLTSTAQERYWSGRERRLRTGKFGESWTMTDGRELLRLVSKGEVALVEATFVCQREKTFEEARAYRAAQVKSADKDRLDVAIDIFAARREIQPV